MGYNKFPTIPVIDSNIFLVFFVFLSFILGVAIQALSSPFEKFVFSLSHGGYPSSRLLDASGATFPGDFKRHIRRLVHEQLGVSPNASSQDMFDMCYTYVVQNNISKRVTTFLNMYSFSRNMSVCGIRQRKDRRAQRSAGALRSAPFAPTKDGWKDAKTIVIELIKKRNASSRRHAAILHHSRTTCGRITFSISA